MSMKRALLGKDDFDSIFGESDGSAYEKQVELDGDDLGAGWVAAVAKPPTPAATNATWNRTPVAEPPPAPSSTLPVRSLTPAELASPLAAFMAPNAPSPSLASITTPTFQANFFTTFGGKSLTAMFPNCVSSKLTMPSKLDDFTNSTIDFSMYADASGNVGYWSGSETS